MELFKIDDYAGIQNPTPGQRFTRTILDTEQGITNMGGLFGLIPAGTKGFYHYHNDREAIIIAISGEAIEIYESKKITIKAGEIIYIPRKHRHGLINESAIDFRFLEFYTGRPDVIDRVDLAWPEGI